MAKEKADNYAVEESLNQLADRLVGDAEKIMKVAKNEEDLRINFENALKPILSELQIKHDPKYEHSIYQAGHTDALHGQVVIEYEPPHAFKSKRGVSHAYEQLIGYIQGLSQETKQTLFLHGTKFIGIGFDGEKIFFVRYKGSKKPTTKLDEALFVLDGPLPFDSESSKSLLIHLRALDRRPLTAENLAEKFGPKSELAPKAVSAFANALEHWSNERIREVFFNEWKRIFGIVYGEQFNGGHQETEAKALAELYKIGQDTDFQELLFSVHTYFALLMKLIAAELLTLRDTAFTSSFSWELTHSTKDELKTKLTDIEEGGIYARKGITNFLEGDFFRWYLDAWSSPELEEAIKDITRTLSEFEPATTTLDPAAARDLLKKLYQYLVPQEVRHRLGEYYTPDWLAELVLNEVGYDGDNRKRVLDPACGSGTFLVLAIQRAKVWGAENKRLPLEIAKSIRTNIWGFDLNPLAVIASRTNYLFALGDLANELKDIEIPIYLADSVLWPEQMGGQRQLNLHGGNYLQVKTSVQEFHVPQIWLRDEGMFMRKASHLVERLVKDGFESEIAMKHLKEKGLAFPPHEKVVESFYKELLQLEQQNKNGIWARFLKNAFAPMTAGKFDFVVGNPPWIMWQYLAPEYREATKNLWEAYGLTEIGQTRNVLIRGRRDFSMLFTYAAADYYLNDNGKLGFLITREVFKSSGAGEGFRRFRLGKGKYLKVLKTHDLVTVQPFEGVTNKTAAIILKKGAKTEYPVPYMLWAKKKGVGKIATDKLLNEISQFLSKKKYLAKPLGSETGTWQTQPEGLDELGKIGGRNNYRAHRGTAIDPYGVFWLEIKQVRPGNTLLVKNLVEHSRRTIPEKEAVVEKDLIHPGIRGSDIMRWQATPEVYVLITHPSSQQPYSEAHMKEKWPYIFNYLIQFREILVDRGVYKHFHARAGNPFYGQRDFGDYTFANHKVVWKRMSNDIFAAVTSEIKTPYGYQKTIPLDTTAFFATNDENEAHYLCAIINSQPVRDFIKSFSSAGRGFGTPSVMEHVGIPKFDPKNKLHQSLANISKQCHELKLVGKDNLIAKLEQENDALVKKLFNKTGD